jgi:hypothetical protein
MEPDAPALRSGPWPDDIDEWECRAVQAQLAEQDGAPQFQPGEI